MVLMEELDGRRDLTAVEEGEMGVCDSRSQTEDLVLEVVVGKW